MTKVLVTGAGGSIGTELCRELLKEGVNLIALDISEYNLWHLQSEVGSTNIEFWIGDVRDPKILESAMQDGQVTQVYHAAALKHVPILEFPNNALEAIRTNVIGTSNVLRAAYAHGAKFCLVSTDKAVKPISVMGATKTFAEMLTQCGVYGKNTTVVRFGNVVGSSGSVIPIWTEQLVKNDPITLTHPDMKRYMMTITEAVHLVVEASKLSAGRFILDMGEAHSMYTVADDLRVRMGKPSHPIKITGIRAGEKLEEELYDADKEVLLVNATKIICVADLGDRAQEYARACKNLKMLQYFTEERMFEEAIELVKSTVGFVGDELFCESL